MAAAIASRRGFIFLEELLAPAVRSFSTSSRMRFVSSSDGDRGDPAAAFRRGERGDPQFISEVLDQSRGELKHDIVHMLIMRNNSFVTVTDSKGNKKVGASAGSLGQGKTSRYACDATAEHVARTGVNLGPAVIKVKGCAFFKKKKEAILGWKEGCSYGDQSKIMQIQDVTRLAHNGCRRRRQRRI